MPDDIILSCTPALASSLIKVQAGQVTVLYTVGEMGRILLLILLSVLWWCCVVTDNPTLYCATVSRKSVRVQWAARIAHYQFLARPSMDLSKYIYIYHVVLPPLSYLLNASCWQGP